MKLIIHFFFSIILLVSSSVLYSAPDNKTRLILLGTGTPNADPNRAGPALAISVGDRSYIVDFGPGIVRQAAALSSNHGGPFESLNSKNLKVVFLTHLHSDHTTGYPDLILTPWVLERSDPLKVFGPKGIKNMTTKILEAYKAAVSYTHLTLPTSDLV